MEASSPLKAAILIVSETAYNDASTDECLPVLKDAFRELGQGQWDVIDTKIVPDGIGEIQEPIRKWTDGDSPDLVNLIITSGGTGFAIKDVTPEAVEPLLHKKASGLVHGMLAASLAITPYATTARPVAGVRNKTVIITLPGSPKGAKENLEAVLGRLPHACVQAAGADSRSLHAGKVNFGNNTHSASEVSEKQRNHQHQRHHEHGHHTPRAHTSRKFRPEDHDSSAAPAKRHRTSPYPMVEVDAALELIATHTSAAKTVQTELLTPEIVKDGVVIARDTKAREPVPAFTASIVDGYAVQIPGSKCFPKGIYPVTLVSRARASRPTTLNEGEIARITTGAPLPLGANAVVMVEDTLLKTRTDDGRDEKEVEILTDKVRLGENVREIGSDVSLGEILMKRGDGFSRTGGEFGLLASAGVTHVDVYKKPTVGVLSTGDELVPHYYWRYPIQHGQVRDTNCPSLTSIIESHGCRVNNFGVAADSIACLKDRLVYFAKRVDVIITTGGVSMGELDLVKPVVNIIGGTIHFGRVNVKPGKPATFATIPSKKVDTSNGQEDDDSYHREDNDGYGQDNDSCGHKPVFALPGNPVSAIVTFFVFVLPTLHRMAGIEPPGLPRIAVTLDEDIPRDAQRPEYCRAVVVARPDGLLYARSTGGQRSSRVGSLKGANALLHIHAGPGIMKKGERVEALLMEQVHGFER